MNGTADVGVIRADALPSMLQREMVSQLVTILPAPVPQPGEAPVAAADLQVITTLRAQLLDEMERLASEEELTQAPGTVIPPERMQAASALCMRGLHYQLVQQAPPTDVIEWVEQALLLLQSLQAISTRQAYREQEVAA
ncbi:MAG: hypothetical protein H0X24_00775 [Ktedonobacterales bacterium]|nr:hypothetical protein [Ktedonobacterales bacterium]